MKNEQTLNMTCLVSNSLRLGFDYFEMGPVLAFAMFEPYYAR